MNPQDVTRDGRAPFSFGRQRRLTVKELRETLRDRRTIVTLVLMPLLVYPLLSITFQRLLFSGLSSKEDALPLVVFESEADGELFRSLMQIDRERYSERENAAPSRQLDLRITDDVQASVDDGLASLGVRVRERHADAPAGDPPLDFELHYYTDATGRQLAAEVESLLRSANEARLSAQLAKLGASLEFPGIHIRKIPREGKTQVSPLATLVPLILILMTITGAVYPAIDLTAGERERGTLETLAASPVTPVAILMAKYLAVVCVAMLTATVNLLAMTLTIYFSGLGPLLFGDAGISPTAVVQVFGLLVLFAMFFSAILLSVTSFARSFKEAQAYLIPLMLIAIAPGLLSMTPGITLSGWLAIVPLVNIVLLSRDVFQGIIEPGIVAICVITTVLYAVAAISVAARVFGRDALMYGSHRGWSDLWKPSEEWSAVPTTGAALFCTALLFPMQFIAGGMIARFPDASMTSRLVASALATVFLFAVFPGLVLRLGRFRPATSLRLEIPRVWSWLAVPLLGISLWPLALELYRLGGTLGLATLSEAHLAYAEKLIAEFRAVPAWLLVLAIGVAPGVWEELFFRGFLFSALRRHLSAWVTLCVTSILFGLFHLVTPSMLATERLLPTTFLGFAL